jgi:hypothetical protein
LGAGGRRFESYYSDQQFAAIALAVERILGKDEVTCSNHVSSTKGVYMSDGGKGSSPRPFSVSQQEYNTRWDAIFGRDLKKEEALDKMVRANEELGLYDMDPSENPLIKK